MTDIMKLADDYAHKYSFVGDDSMPVARAALQSAIEALQGECAELQSANDKLNDDCAMHMRVAVKAIDEVVEVKAERDALQAKLDELQRQEPALVMCHQNAMGEDIAPPTAFYVAPKGLEPLTDKKADAIALDIMGFAVLDKEQAETARMLIRATEAAHGIGSQQAPKALEPLTDDAIWKNDALMSANSGYGATFETLREIIRAVEAAHGIGASK